MSTAAAATPAPPETSVWLNQLKGILRLEVRKNVFSARALPLYMLAALPVGILLLALLLPKPDGQEAISAATVFAAAFRFYFLRGALFLGTLFIFMQLFRGDVMDRSLHFYFLCPVRRELLVTGKYLAGIASTCLVLMASVTMSFALMNMLLAGSGGRAFAQLAVYLGVVVLGVLGYGSCFMLTGLYFKNPVIAPILLFIWELANPFLPALLKKFSIIYYLSSMLPVPADVGPFEVLADPISPWLAVPGLLAVTALAIWLSAQRIRRMEITYTDD